MSLYPSQYHVELHRLASFAKCEGFQHVAALAKLGFYWKDGDRRLYCNSCEFSLSSWDSSDEVIQRHRHSSPQCTAVTDNNTDSEPVAISPEDIENKLRMWTSHLLSDGTRVRRHQRDTTDCNEDAPFIIQCRNVMERARKKGILRYRNVHIDLKNPDFELLKDERTRLNTFSNWSRDSHVTAVELARNGMFYTGSNDKVQCVFCRGYLHGWAPGDVVADEHRKFFPSCPIVTAVDCGNVRIEVHSDCGERYVADTAVRSLPLSEQENYNSIQLSSIEQNRLMPAVSYH